MTKTATMGGANDLTCTCDLLLGLKEAIRDLARDNIAKDHRLIELAEENKHLRMKVKAHL